MSTVCTSRTLQADPRQQRRPSAAGHPTEARRQVPMRQRSQMLVQSIASLPNGANSLTISHVFCAGLSCFIKPLRISGRANQILCWPAYDTLEKDEHMC